jgi:exocyst complex component 8
MSVWTGSDKFPIPDPSSMPAIPAWAIESGAGGAKEKVEADARWISDFSDDLTVAIALQEWDEAVRLVEEGDSITGLSSDSLY